MQDQLRRRRFLTGHPVSRADGFGPQDIQHPRQRRPRAGQRLGRLGEVRVDLVQGQRDEREDRQIASEHCPAFDRRRPDRERCQHRQPGRQHLHGLGDPARPGTIAFAGAQLRVDCGQRRQLPVGQSVGHQIGCSESHLAHLVGELTARRDRPFVGLPRPARRQPGDDDPGEHRDRQQDQCKGRVEDRQNRAGAQEDDGRRAERQHDTHHQIDDALDVGGDPHQQVAVAPPQQRRATERGIGEFTKSALHAQCQIVAGQPLEIAADSASDTEEPHPDRGRQQIQHRRMLGRPAQQPGRHAHQCHRAATGEDGQQHRDRQPKPASRFTVEQPDDQCPDITHRCHRPPPRCH